MPFLLGAALEGSVALGVEADASLCYLRQVAADFITWPFVCQCPSLKNDSERNNENRRTGIDCQKGKQMD